MSRIAIRVENVGKRFRLGLRPPHTRFSELLYGAVKAAASASARWARRHREADGETGPAEFWALRGVSFEVPEGEVLGIIGRNGAGKSTLLKILSRIIEPTTGRFGIRGRVGSLLEVGTGFHPELTGRENIFLNGAILGMSRQEIRRKFDEIVAFAEIEEFLGMPVKRYSSGMYMRLAFAVAAHLEPEVLIVDEVLAVGDVPFQRKCLACLHDLSERGHRTVLLVSHNAAALSSLCSRGLVLDHGTCYYQGEIREALHRYAALTGGDSPEERQEWRGPAGDEFMQLERAWVRPLTGSVFDAGADIEVGGVVTVRQPIDGLTFGFRLFSDYGYELAYVLYDDRETGLPRRVEPSRIIQSWIIPARTLAAGHYRIAFQLGIAYRHQSYYRPPGELAFKVENVSGLGRRYPEHGAQGVESLFRPDWTGSRRVEPLS